MRGCSNCGVRSADCGVRIANCRLLALRSNFSLRIRAVVLARLRFGLVCTAWTDAADCRTINGGLIDGLEPGPMSGPLSAPSKKATTLRRVAILFAGGPGPAANTL